MWLNAQPAYRCQRNWAPFKIKGLWFRRNTPAASVPPAVADASVTALYELAHPSQVREHISSTGFEETVSSLDEAIFRARRRRPETVPIQASQMIKQRSSVMPTIFDLLYREYCRARLAEMRQQLLIRPGSREVLEANCDASRTDCAADRGSSRLGDAQREPATTG